LFFFFIDIPGLFLRKVEKSRSRAVEQLTTVLALVLLLYPES
jgi:hypothetical protein